MLFAALATSTPALGYESNWVKIRDAVSFEGTEISQPIFIDINSPMRSTDGFILFKKARVLPKAPWVPPEDIKKQREELIFKDFKYEAIDCKKDLFVTHNR